MARKREEQRGRKRKPKVEVKDVSCAYARMNAQLLALGLFLKEVPGDGNCLFRALGDQLEGHMMNHMLHRELTVAYMREHRDDFEPFLEDDVPYEKYVDRLGWSGTYAGNDAIVAFARYYSVLVVIHQLDEPLWQIHGTPALTWATRELHVAYQNGDHYDSVRKCGDHSPKPPHLNIVNKCKKPASPASTPASQQEADDVLSTATDGVDGIYAQVEQQTGCTDLALIQSALEDNEYDVEATVDFILNLQIINSRLHHGLQPEASGGSDVTNPPPTAKRKPCRRKGSHDMEKQSSQENLDTQSLLKSLQLLSI